MRVGFCNGIHSDRHVSRDDRPFDGSDMCGCKGNISIDPILKLIYIFNWPEAYDKGRKYTLPMVKEGDIIGCFIKLTKRTHVGAEHVLNRVEFYLGRSKSNVKKFGGQLDQPIESPPLPEIGPIDNFFPSKSTAKKSKRGRKPKNKKTVRAEASHSRDKRKGKHESSSSKPCINPQAKEDRIFATFSLSAFNSVIFMPNREQWQLLPDDRIGFEFPLIRPPVLGQD